MDRYEICEDGTLWHEAYYIRIGKSDDAPSEVGCYYFCCWPDPKEGRWARESNRPSSLRHQPMV